VASAAMAVWFLRSMHTMMAVNNCTFHPRFDRSGI
jgi:hypothetical protein